jgi:hypothetical protein
MSYDNNMRGLISKNDRKTEDKHPDIKGQCEIDGTEYWISGWLKEKKDGSGKFYSLVFQAKEPKPEPRPEPQQKDPFAGLDDDIPAF